MNQTYREAVVKASVGEMLNALVCETDNIPDHAMSHCLGFAENPDGTISVELLFGPSLPKMIAEISGDGNDESEDGAIGIKADFRTNPSALELRFKPSAASVSLVCADGETATLSPEQQYVVDRYASAAAFWLTGAANGALCKSQEIGPDEFPDMPDMASSVVERKVNRIREALATAASESDELAGILELRALNPDPGMLINAGEGFRKVAQRVRIADAMVDRVFRGPRHAEDEQAA